MRVWELRDGFGLEQLRLADRPDPKPGPDQVVLRIHAVSLNYRDTLVVRGGYGPRFKVPLIPVSDGVGTIVEMGERVEGFRIGDRVCPMFFQGWIGGRPTPQNFRFSLGGDVDGVLSEFMAVPGDSIARVPDHLSDAQAATLPCAALTAWSAIVTQGQVTPGDYVLVQGTGGVALFAMQFAKLAGARVILTSASDEKLEQARKLGADHVINYRQIPEWDRVVKELTGGEGCDHVVELSGAETLDRSVRAARIGGMLSLIGVLSGARAAITLPLVVMRNIRLQGVTVGSRDAFEAMCRAIDHHRLRPIVERSFDFSQVPSAFTSFEAHRPLGKLAIVFD